MQQDIDPAQRSGLRIVITGASGNLGSGVLRALSSHMPDAELVGVCRRPPERGGPFRSVEWHAVDLSTPDAERLLAPAMRAADVVVHLALAVRPVRDVDYLFRANVRGSEAVFAATRTAGVGHLIHASSLGVYSPGAGQPVNETWPTEGRAHSTYSRHKVQVERMLDRLASDCPELAVARLRPTVVVQRDAAHLVRALYLGPVIPGVAIKALRAGALPVLPLPAHLRLQFVHADDVGDAVVKVIRNRAQGAFNVAADVLDTPAIAALVKARPITVSPTLVRRMVLSLSRIRLLAVTPGWYDVATNSPIMDTSRAHDELGWTPRWSSTASAHQLIDGLAAGTPGPTPAMGSLERRQDAGSSIVQWLHDGSLALWGLLAAGHAVKRTKANRLDAVVVAVNLLAGTPMALQRMQERRRDVVAVLAPVGVASSLVTYPRGGWVPVACLGALGLIAGAERRRTGVRR